MPLAIMPDTERSIRRSRDLKSLVKQARYASEKYADKLTADLGDQMRHQAVFDLVLIRIHELGHKTIARLLKDEHCHRLQVMGLRTTVDRLAEEGAREADVID